MVKTKNVTMSMIKEDNRKYKEFLSIDVEVNGESHEVKLYPFFSPEKVAKLRDELYEFKLNADKEKLNINEAEWSDIVGYFILKYFTNITMTTSKKAKVIYKEFKEVINSRVSEFLLKQFDQDSILYVHDKINEIADMEAILLNKIKQVQEEIKSLPLENKDILLGKNRKQIPEV
ncbi:hypothetical protein CHH83_02675 [Bacillus sp. 7586-K]|nr:hypothetical protein CHH83_02675 [Bacillus sp. 7586-K]